MNQLRRTIRLSATALIKTINAGNNPKISHIDFLIMLLQKLKEEEINKIVDKDWKDK